MCIRDSSLCPYVRIGCRAATGHDKNGETAAALRLDDGCTHGVVHTTLRAMGLAKPLSTRAVKVDCPGCPCLSGLCSFRVIAVSFLSPTSRLLRDEWEDGGGVRVGVRGVGWGWGGGGGERERETDRQTDRQTDRETETETERQRDRDRERQRQRERDRDSDRDRDREMHRLFSRAEQRYEITFKLDQSMSYFCSRESALELN